MNSVSAWSWHRVNFTGYITEYMVPTHACAVCCHCRLQVTAELTDRPEVRTATMWNIVNFHLRRLNHAFHIKWQDTVREIS